MPSIHDRVKRLKKHYDFIIEKSIEMLLYDLYVHDYNNIYLNLCTKFNRIYKIKSFLPIWNMRKCNKYYKIYKYANITTEPSTIIKNRLESKNLIVKEGINSYILNVTYKDENMKLRYNIGCICNKFKKISNLPDDIINNIFDYISLSMNENKKKIV